jgi:hypothetical protein
VDLILIMTFSTTKDTTFALNAQALGLKNATNILVRLSMVVVKQTSLKLALQLVIINATVR